jgi:uncharacterized cupredoxin-like copper-binding protein
MIRAGVAAIVAGLALVGTLVAWRSAGPSVRTVDITIHFSHFDASSITVDPGETVRFVIHNEDPIAHEFIVGDRYVQLIHEIGTEPSHGAKPGEVSIPAVTTAETTYTFPTNAIPHLQFACHLPGHYAYGMHGSIVIAERQHADW